MAVRRKKGAAPGVHDLKADPNNANRGSSRGASLISRSIEEYGFARSIVIDRDLLTIAGAQVLKEAKKRNARIRIIDSEGDELIVVRRKDLSVADRKARELGVLDNQATIAGHEWDPEVLARLRSEGARLETIFDPKEIARLLPDRTSKTDKFAGIPQAIQLRPAREYVVVLCAEDDGAEFDRLKETLGLRPVRRGGYKPGSPFEAVGMQRVVPAADLLRLLEGKGKRRR